MRRPALLVAALLVATGAAAQDPAGEVTWPANHYNPTPLDGDRVVPMPCGGAMVFRPVVVPDGDHPYGHAVVLGTDAPDVTIGEYPRQTYLSPPFAGDEAGFHQYWIGKYEVTLDQYQAVLSARCQPPSSQGKRPVSDITWDEAVRFANYYTRWLFRTVPDSLPQVDSVPAFVRLPTAVEWEYATRGGMAVDAATFRRRLFPMQGGLADYAWYQGPDSAAGRLRPIGLLEPNPLGLYDVLGNVEELVLEPLRIGGRVGGFVAMGGSILTPDSRLRSSFQQEFAFVDPYVGQPLRLDTFGLRLALGSPVGTGYAQIRALRDDLQDLAGGGDAPVDVPVLVVEVPADDADAAGAGDPADERERRALEVQVARLEADLGLLNEIIARLQLELAEVGDRSAADQALLDEQAREIERLAAAQEERRAEIVRLEQALDASEQALTEAALACGTAELEPLRRAMARGLAGDPGVVVLSDRLVIQAEALFVPDSAALTWNGKSMMTWLTDNLMQEAGGESDTVSWTLHVAAHMTALPAGSDGRLTDWELSVVRAINLARFLQSAGVPVEALAPAGHGSQQPLMQGEGDQAWNRRVEFRLLPASDPQGEDCVTPAGSAVAAFAAVVRQAVQPCLAPADGDTPQPPVVQVDVAFRPDGRVRTAIAADSEAYEDDAAYRALADGVIDALNDPACQPLPLPADRFADWQTLTVAFGEEG